MIAKKQDGVGVRTTAQPTTGKPRQATDRPPSPISAKPLAPSGDYLIPRQEAAYSIGFQRGIEIGMQVARERGETREITATATTVVSAQVVSRPTSPFSIDGPRTLEASDRGFSWVMITMNALTCVMMAYVAIKLMLKGF